MTARDPRTTTRIEADLRTGQTMDPLDMLNRSTLQLLWAQEGRRLLARQDAVAVMAAANNWEFTALDTPLSARLAEQDVTAGARGSLATCAGRQPTTRPGLWT